MNRQHVEHISRSYCKNSPLNLVSVDYTVDYPNENAIFYSLQGKNNSYYFPSKERTFFMEPAYGKEFKFKNKISIQIIICKLYQVI